MIGNSFEQMIWTKLNQTVHNSDSFTQNDSFSEPDQNFNSLD